MFGKRKIFTAHTHAIATMAFGLALLFALFIAPSPAQAAGRPVYCEHYHTVQQGEHIASIADYYSVNYYDIGADNGLKYPFYLAVGQSLCINGATLPVSQTPPSSQLPVTQAPVSQAPPMLEEPAVQAPAQVAGPAQSGPQSQPSYSCTYVVKSGDMLSRIARYHGISMRALAKSNNLQNVNWIYVGQQLTVPCM